jgi:hypothetical protein
MGSTHCRALVLSLFATLDAYGQMALFSPYPLKDFKKDFRFASLG